MIHGEYLRDESMRSHHRSIDVSLGVAVQNEGNRAKESVVYYNELRSLVYYECLEHTTTPLFISVLRLTLERLCGWLLVVGNSPSAITDMACSVLDYHRSLKHLWK